MVIEDLGTYRLLQIRIMVLCYVLSSYYVKLLPSGHDSLRRSFNADDMCFMETAVTRNAS